MSKVLPLSLLVLLLFVGCNGEPSTEGDTGGFDASDTQDVAPGEDVDSGDDVGPTDDDDVGPPDDDDVGPTDDADVNQDFPSGVEPLPLGSGPIVWVDNSCPTNGDGSSEDCDAGESGPYNDLHVALADAEAGQTIQIKEGTGSYVTTNLGDYTPRADGGFHIHPLTDSTDPITIRPAPGHNPILANCAVDDFENYCPNPTFTAGGARIVFDGLTIQGGIVIRGDVAVTRSRLSKGWEPEGDGNIGTIKVMMPGGWETANVGPFRNNYFHDLHGLETSAFTAAWIYIFHSRNIVVEYNTFEGFEYSGGQGALLDKHSHSENLVFRYNLIIDGKGGAFGNQADFRSYGNVIHCGVQGRAAMEIANADQFHNTVVDCSSALYVTREDERYPERQGTRDGELYNNIFDTIHDANLRRWEPTGEEPEYFTGLEHIDFNAYTPDRYFWWLHNHYGISWQEWQEGIAADFDFDQNSDELICEFLDAAAHDYRLQPGSACTTFGREGGVDSGEPVELGAFAVTDCVGHQCYPGASYIPYDPSWRTGSAW